MSGSVDYSDEMRPARAAWTRKLFIVLGSVFFGLGIAGIFLPLLPTTPFLLLSAWCYARGSAKFYNWLMNHPLLGQYIRDWRAGRGIPMKAKVTAAILIVITFGFSTRFIPLLYAKIAFCSIGGLVILFLFTRPTRAK